MKVARRIDENGNRIFGVDDVVELLYRGVDVDGFIVEPAEEVDYFSRYCRKFHLSAHLRRHDQANTTLSHRWVLPQRYLDLDVRSTLYERCERDEEIERVREELDLYERFQLMDLLRALFYIVDLMRKNNIVWGVGRGSSVSSYVLFLIGVHKIDSIHFHLDIHDFFKITD